MSGRLFLLVDCHALLYRGHFAMMRNPLRARDGTNTSGLFFLIRELLDRRDVRNPDVIAAVFDHPSPVFRVEIYPEYKANRPGMPEELRVQSDLARKLVPLLGIPLLEQEGFEADDIIAWLSCEADEQGQLVEILSSDKDLLQLASDSVLIIRPGRGGSGEVEVGKDDVESIMGVRADQLADFLALTGDSSDNIPGAKGIGKKTATRLLQEYNDLDGIYESIDSISPATRKKLLQYRDMVEVSRRLASLKPPRELAIHLDDLRMSPPSLDEAASMLDRLGMNSIMDRLGITSQKDLFSDIGNVPDMSWCETAIAGNLEEISNSEFAAPGDHPVAIDTETTSKDPFDADPVGLSIASDIDSALYIPLTGKDALETAEVARILGEKSVLLTPVAQNGKYDMHILESMGLRLNGLSGDPMIADYLLRPEIRSHSLANLSITWLGKRMQEYSDILGDAGSLADVPTSRVADYCGCDAVAALILDEKLRGELEKDPALLRLYDEVELPLVRVIADMERRGVGLDTGSLQELEHEFSEDIEKLETSAAGILGHGINLNSPSQVSSALFDELGLESVRKTSTGADSSSMEVLERLRGQHPLVDVIIDHRELSKLLNTYILRLPEYVNGRDGLIHTSFSQTVTATGRLSSSSPNLQNIPIRTSRGREVRKCFIPGQEGYVFVTADYSQIELRVLAHLAGPGSMREAYRGNMDIHSNTSIAVFGDASPEHRRRAKEVNFSILYGISPWGLSNRINVSRSEAAEIIAKYVATYPEVESFFEQCVEYAEKNGETRTILGRKREFRGFSKAKGASRSSMERMAVNTTVQGSAADIIKLAMIRVDERLKEVEGAGLVLQVHDELVARAPVGRGVEVSEILREEMESAYDLEVPLMVDTGSGSNWLEAQH
jgi:DNA polymerase I